MMNLSEYYLIVALMKEVEEPAIAIMIAKDALSLGKRIFNVKKTIDETQKQIVHICNDINNMTKENAIIYCNQYHNHNYDYFYDDNCDIIRAKHIAGHVLDEKKIHLFHLIESYESIMGTPYSIDYLVQKEINNVKCILSKLFKKFYSECSLLSLK